MDAHATRRTLLLQHDQIREQLNECSILARRLLDGEPVELALDAALGELRHRFAEHNDAETQLVRPLLHGAPHYGSLLIDRMLEEHVAEHGALWELLSGSSYRVALRMEELVDELDAHMAAEERSFLSPLALRSPSAEHAQAE